MDGRKQQTSKEFQLRLMYVLLEVLSTDARNWSTSDKQVYICQLLSNKADKQRINKLAGLNNWFNLTVLIR